jgi:general secretion pathway protein C
MICTRFFRDPLVDFSLRLRSLTSSLPGWLEKSLWVVLCWQFAGLFWVLFAPASPDFKLVMPSQGAGQSVVTADALLRWYGGDTTADAPEEYALLAVIAGSKGAAVVKRGSDASVAIRVGEELSAGNRLVAVEPEQITIERAGVRSVVKLPQKNTPALFTGVAPPPAKSLPAIKMTRGQMAGVIQGGNLGSWDKGLSSFADGGVRVDNAAVQPLARMLQFKSGDILKSINGRRLNQVSDSSLLFHYFGQQSSVDVVLIRDGATLTQHYDIQP